MNSIKKQSKIVSNIENLQVLYEDNHIIIINKRSGDIVQGDKTGDTPLSDVVKSYIKKKYNKPGAVYLGVTHRLDRPTTGVVVFTKTSKALTRMNKLFLNKDIEKTYWAIVKNIPNKYLYNPWEAPQDILAEANIELGKDYPQPIVDLKQSREKALDAFSVIRIK